MEQKYMDNVGDSLELIIKIQEQMGEAMKKLQEIKKASMCDPSHEKLCKEEALKLMIKSHEQIKKTMEKLRRNGKVPMCTPSEPSYEKLCKKEGKYKCGNCAMYRCFGCTIDCDECDISFCKDSCFRKHDETHGPYPEFYPSGYWGPR